MERKKVYVSHVVSLCQEYSKIIVVSADHVGSRQMSQIRKALVGKAQILMGKNTLIRRGMKKSGKKEFEAVFPYLKGNVGCVFTNSDLSEVREILIENKVKAPAKTGNIAPVDVVLPAQNTGMEPTKTSFFQALGITTKITRGTVEILNDTPILAAGDKVGSSEAALLKMLDINPFFYGLKVVKIYDNGTIYDESVLSMTDEVVLQKLQGAINNIAAISLETGIPTEASVPHSLANGFKNLLAVAVETDYSFKQAESVLEFLKDPTKFIKQEVTETKEEKKEEKKEASESEEGDMGMGLFGEEEESSE